MSPVLRMAWPADGVTRTQNHASFSYFHLCIITSLKPVLQLTGFPNYTCHSMPLETRILSLGAPVAQMKGSLPGVCKVVISQTGFPCPTLKVAEPAYEMHIVIRETIPAAGWRGNYCLIVFSPSILTHWPTKII